MSYGPCELCKTSAKCYDYPSKHLRKVTNIGHQVRFLRNRLGLTQKQFAVALAPKVDYTYIGKIERGDQYPSIKMLERMGRAFNKPLSYWFEGDTEVCNPFGIIQRKADRIKALACLLAKYCWDEGRFSVCPITCEIQDNLCGAVKALVAAKEICLDRKRQKA